MLKSILVLIVYVLLLCGDIQAQVLSALDNKQGMYGLTTDKGSTGLWFQLKKLRTTASLMHTTAHPDDEHAALLTDLSRGQGVRTSLLTINRGEAGANATGSELFDALGLVRTEELLRSGQYYGLDDQYFTTLTDYGYSKQLDEALRSWGREAVLEDMVRIIRMNRPFVIVSRFHGSGRDGHGHHQAAGGITPEAFRAAADPERFPDQIEREGLSPWKAMKLFRGGVRQDEPHHIEFNQSVYDPVLANTYYGFGYFGLSLQRSQTSGRVWAEGNGPALYYEQLDVDTRDKSDGFFEGMDTSISGMFSLFGLESSGTIAAQLDSMEQAVENAVASFQWDHPEATVPALVRSLTIARNLADQELPDEVKFLIDIKIKQIQEAIHTALGMRVGALAVKQGTPPVESRWAPPPILDGVVPGQQFMVYISVHPGVNTPYSLQSIWFDTKSGIEVDDGELKEELRTMHNQLISGDKGFQVPVRVTEGAEADRPYFYRSSIEENQYSTLNEGYHLPHGPAAMKVHIGYEVEGVYVEISEGVRMRRANLPYGYKLEPLRVLPRVALNVTPSTRMIPVGQGGNFTVEVEITNNDDSGVHGMASLNLPDGWRSMPETQEVMLSSTGERNTFTFEVEAGKLTSSSYDIQVECTIDGFVYSEGYQQIERNELETQYLFKPASIRVQGVDVKIANGLQVGYIMGVGDEVPSGIEQLGANVTLLNEQELSRGDLSGYDVIVVGTRAYAVREDLINYNNRLIEFAEQGGHLLVLYQTPEYNPEDQAPYPGSLPRNAEETSEQDSPLTILNPDHPVFHYPNSITAADFEGWVEQRGSKFFASWDERYEPLVEMYDTGQSPQQGAWLTASVGEGRYTYFAIAIHRQTPYAVPGPYRIFANVLSLGR